MNIRAIRTRVFKEGDDLVAFIGAHVRRIPERAVLVVTSKIVALAEGRTADPKDRERIIKAESSFALRTKYTWLTIKDGTVMASAGVDESNAAGKLVLLPKDSFAAAESLRRTLKKLYRVKKLGVLITDSRLLPLRAGVVGVALGYSGFKGVRDYRGTKDIFGRVFKLSRTDVADSLATAAVLCMGEGKEQLPLALITGAPIAYSERVNRTELHIDPREDVYAPLFSAMSRKNTI
jgi:coenzyme F420-0:L-glutamate ligase